MINNEDEAACKIEGWDHGDIQQYRSGVFTYKNAQLYLYGVLRKLQNDTLQSKLFLPIA
jgi:hypothetical protein